MSSIYPDTERISIGAGDTDAIPPAWASGMLISIGAGDTDAIPPAWASGMLTWIREHHSAVFTEALAATLGLELPVHKKPPAPAKTKAPAPPALSVASGRHAESS